MSVIAPTNISAVGTALSDSPNNMSRLSSAAKEFESVLLGQWLKDAESTFGSVPGSEEEDAGGEQMKEFAMQHVATDITAHGGIGIAPMVERALAKQEAPQIANHEGDGL